MIIEQQWCFKAFVVDLLENEPAREAIAIAELRGASEWNPKPGVGSWIDFHEISKSEIDGACRSIVEKLLKDGATGRGAFSRFGWIEEALDWISAEARIDRAQFTDDIKQFNASADSALVRFGKGSASPIWFKAAGDPSKFEYRLTTMLSQMLPDFLPDVVGTREDWSAWCMKDAGRPLGSVPSQGVFKEIITRLANIQKASIDLAPNFFASGCLDQRLPVLGASISPMLDLIDDAMIKQDFGLAQRLTSERIRQLEVILTEACLGLDSLGIPDALLHGDISFENILVGPRGCVFTDWANAAVGNPFVTFEQLRAQIEQDNYACVWLPMLTEIYVQSWHEVLSSSQIERALILVPPIAAMTYLFDCWKRLGTERLAEPKFQSFIRGLARQIDRAAFEIEFRRTRCA